MATRKEATLRLYEALNHPAQASRVWVKYERKVIDAALDVCKQLMELEGYGFKPETKCVHATHEAPGYIGEV